MRFSADSRCKRTRSDETLKGGAGGHSACCRHIASTIVRVLTFVTGALLASANMAIRQAHTHTLSYKIAFK